MPTSRKPNILLINTHDSGRFFGCYGVATARTPHIDRLASEGVLFEEMSAASPICSPSRASMVTGRWPQRHGLLGLTHHGFRLHPGERHAASLFREAGYSTTLFHFQHVAAHDEWGNLGFEQFLARSRDEEEDVYPYMARPAPEVADAVAVFLADQTGDRPFFAQVNFNETHTPFHFGGVVPDRADGVTVPPWIETDADAKTHFAHLQGAVHVVDNGVGTILDALEEQGLANDTIVVFATDHGLEGSRDKWSLYESGLAAAAIVRGPQWGIRSGQRLRAPVSNVDLLPTLLDLAGLPLPDNLDGRSLAAALRGEAALDLERPIFGIYHNSGVRSVRCGLWKLIRNYAAEPYLEQPPATLRKRKPRHPRPFIELYDLAADPHEFVNLADKHPETVARLDRELNAWMREVGDPVACPLAC